MIDAGGAANGGERPVLLDLPARAPGLELVAGVPGARLGAVEAFRAGLAQRQHNVGVEVPGIVTALWDGVMQGDIGDHSLGGELGGDEAPHEGQALGVR